MSLVTRSLAMRSGVMKGDLPKRGPDHPETSLPFTYVFCPRKAETLMMYLKKLKNSDTLKRIQPLILTWNAQL